MGANFIIENDIVITDKFIIVKNWHNQNIIENVGTCQKKSKIEKLSCYVGIWKIKKKKNPKN